MKDSLCSNKQYNLDDTNFVGNIQCIIIWSQPNIGFLRTIRPDQSVNFLGLVFDFILNKSENVLIQIAVIAYNIWFAKNLIIFEDRYLPHEEIIQKAIHNISEFQSATLQEPSSDPLQPLPARCSRSRSPFQMDQIRSRLHESQQ